MTPLEGSKVIVNGNAVSQTTELQHLVGLNTQTLWLCVIVHTQTQSIFLALFCLPVGPSHSRFKLYLPVYWLSLWEGRGRLEPLRLRLLPVWAGRSWRHPPGWAGEDWLSRGGILGRKLLMYVCVCRWVQCRVQSDWPQPAGRLLWLHQTDAHDGWGQPDEPGAEQGDYYIKIRFLKYHIFFVFVASCVHSYILTSALCCLPCFQGVEFKLEIKNLALSDSKGHDLKKELVVRVTAKGRKQVDPSSSLSFTQSSSYTSVQFQSRSEFLSLCSNSILRFGFGPRPSLWTANSWWKMSTSSTRLKRAEEM